MADDIKTAQPEPAVPHSSALHMKQSFGVNVSETYFSVC